MKRISFVIVLLVSVSQVSAEIYDVTLSGTTTEAVTYYLCGTALIGSPVSSCTTSPGLAATASPSQGADALEVRNALVSVNGHDIGTVEVGRVHLDGTPALRSVINASFKVQYWISLDESTWTLLEPSIPVTLSGITFTAFEEGTTRETSLVPALGSFGMGAMVLALLGAGTLL